MTLLLRYIIFRALLNVKIELRKRGIYSQKKVRTKNKAKKQFVFFEERPTDVAVVAVAEMIRQILQATVQQLRFRTEIIRYIKHP